MDKNSSDTETLNAVLHRLLTVEQKLDDIHELLQNQRLEKEWYTTGELAEAVGKSQYTVQERWCNESRIDCEKDPDTGKWRIPGEEFRRIVGGGKLRPRRKAK